MEIETDIAEIKTDIAEIKPNASNIEAKVSSLEDKINWVIGLLVTMNVGIIINIVSQPVLG